MKRKPANLSESLCHRLNSYALAASAAGVGVMALAQPAEAKIVYTKTHKHIQGIGDRVYLDLNHDGHADFVLGISHFRYSYGTRLVANRVYNQNTIRNSGSSTAAAFKAGVLIGPKGNIRKPPKNAFGYMLEHGCAGESTGCGTSGPWLNVKDRYMGLGFVVNGKTHYGWARLNASESPRYGVRATLTGYAYETIPGKGIITGKTKGPDVITLEPGSLGRLAQGSAGK